MEYRIKILAISEVTHNVRSLRTEKPAGYSYKPGQATELSINNPEWREQKRPFTFTSLEEDPYLEFTIKCYSDHEGVTNAVRKLNVGDELLIGDTWGAIEYKGPGYFIAGGAGITPFLAIIRRLSKDGQLKGNRLIFSNRTVRDIIGEKELAGMLGEDAIFLTTDEPGDNRINGFIDKAFIEHNITDFTGHFYVCGPEKMVSDIQNILQELGANPDSVIFEK